MNARARRARFRSPRRSLVVRPADKRNLDRDPNLRRPRRAMNLVWAALVIVIVAALAVAAMLFVRRGAPEGSYFVDGDRAAGVFGVLATGFAILAGFVVVLAFESY